MKLRSDSIKLTTSDIADIAGVGRSTVSNWRSRYSDFPQPVSGSVSSPRFDEAEIHSWLKGRGKRVRTISADSILWSVMDKWRGGAPLENVACFVSALIAWRYISDPASSGFVAALPNEAQWPNLVAEKHDPLELHHKLSRSLQEFDLIATDEHRMIFDDLIQVNRFSMDINRSGLLKDLVVTLDGFEANTLGQIYVEFQDRLTNSMRRGYDEFSTSSQLISLLVSITQKIPGPVHDPAVGSGRLLLAVGEQGEHRSLLTGQDINLSACVQAKQRALVTGRMNVTIRQGDIFENEIFEQGLARVVVLDPPYGMSHHAPERLALDHRLSYGTPPKSRIDIAWLQLALWYLGPQGRAFVLQPTGTSFRKGAESKIRANLLKSGTVEAVVSLPAGSAAHTSIPLDLWVLASPGESADPSKVLLIDQSDRKEIDVQTISACLENWRTDRAEPSEPFAGIFDVNDILAEGSVLNPKQWIASSTSSLSVETINHDFAALQKRLEQIQSTDLANSVSISAGKTPPKIVSISDLEKTGSLEIIRSREHISSTNYASDGTPAVSGEWIHGNEDQPRRIKLESLSREPVITQPGDVLVQNAGGLAARVDSEGGRVLVTTSFQLLRLKEDSLLPEYFAQMLVSELNRRQAVGTIPRIPVKDLKIPLLPIVDQSRLVKHFEELRQLREAAQDLFEKAHTARNSVVDGVTEGVIQVF